MDRVWISKCESCGSKGRVFPDQIKTIQDNTWSPFKKLLPPSIGAKWICIACDSRWCLIVGYEPDERAYKLQKIRSRGQQNIDRDIKNLQDRN